MRTSAYLTAGMLGLMMLSGCLVGDEDNETSPEGFGDGIFGGNNTTSPSPSPTFGGNNTSSASNPPTANLTADTENGSAPLDVNFTIEASDPDGDLHSWVLDFGDGNKTNGTDVPEDPVNHTYEAEGNFTANLTVVDARGATATSSVNISVEAGSTAEPLTHEDDVTAPCTACSIVGTSSSSSRQTGIQGIDSIWVELTPEHVGATFTVESTGGDPDIAFFETCVSGHIDTVGEAGGESGAVPDGAGCMMAWEFLDGGSTITIEVG